MSEETKCSLSKLVYNKPKGSTSRIVRDNIIVNVTKKDIQNAIVPGVTVCDNLCFNKDLGCKTEKSKFLTSLDNTNSSFWSGVNLTEDESVTDNVTPVVLWTGNNISKGGMSFTNEASNFSNFLFYLPTADTSGGNAYREGNALRKFQPKNNPTDTSYLLSGPTEGSEATYLLVIDRPTRFNYYRLSISLRYVDSEEHADAFTINVGAGAISYSRQNEDGNVPTMPTGSHVVFGYNNPDTLVILISTNQRGIVNLICNGLQKRLIHTMPVTYPNNMLLISLLTTNEIVDDISIVYREVHLFKGSITKEIKDFYNSLLEKYEINPVYLPSSNLRVANLEDQSNVVNFIDANNAYYFYFFNEMTPKLSYNSATSGSNGYGLILRQISNVTDDIIYVENITFSPNPPSHFLNGLRFTTITQVGEDQDIEVFTLSDLPYIILPDSSIFDETGNSVLSYLSCNSTTAMSYTGTMTLTLKQNGLTETLDVPLVYTIT